MTVHDRAGLAIADRAGVPPGPDRPAWAGDILGFRARVRGPAPVLRMMPALFPPAPAWATASAASSGVDFEVRRDPARPECYVIARDGEPLGEVTAWDDILPTLEWAIDTAAVEHLGGRYLLLHAGALARDGRGLILPAASGSGKTTLTAALLRAGFQYLGDEVAALQLATWRLVPFAKSLCVKPGSRRALAPLYPQLAADDQRVAYIRPPDDGWPAAPVPVRHVVFPEYVSGARAALTPLTRAAALPRLLAHGFNVAALGARGVEGLVELLRGVECYALTTGDLNRAVEALVRVTGS